MRTIKTTIISILAVSLLAGAAFGVAAQDEPNMEAAEVTGRTFMLAERRSAGGDFVFLELGGTVNTGAVGGTWSTSDPRLNGLVTRTVTWHWDPASDTVLDSHAYELTNDGGSWVGEGHGYLTDLRGDPRSVRWVTLTGRDGYEGLSAMVVLETADVLQPAALNLEGVIFPGEVLEVPEPDAGDYAALHVVA